MSKPEGQPIVHLCMMQGCTYPEWKEPNQCAPECPLHDCEGFFFLKNDLAARDAAVRREALEKAVQICRVNRVCRGSLAEAEAQIRALAEKGE